MDFILSRIIMSYVISMLIVVWIWVNIYDNYKKFKILNSKIEELSVDIKNLKERVI